MSTKVRRHEHAHPGTHACTKRTLVPLHAPLDASQVPQPRPGPCFCIHWERGAQVSGPVRAPLPWLHGCMLRRTIASLPLCLMPVRFVGCLSLQDDVECVQRRGRRTQLTAWRAVW